MKKIYKILLVMLISVNGFAQDDMFYHLNYNPSIPFGSTSDFTEGMTWRGFGFGFKQFVKDRVAVGLDVSWSTFDALERNATMDYNNLTITGTQYRYLNTVPLHATFSYIMGDEEFKYFAGIGVGTSWTEIIREVGVYSLTTSEWQFSFSPEIGVSYKVLRDLAPFFKVKYNYAVKNGNFDSVSYLSFNVGIAFN